MYLYIYIISILYYNWIMLFFQKFRKTRFTSLKIHKQATHFSSKKRKSTKEDTIFITEMPFITNMVNVWEILIKRYVKLTQNWDDKANRKNMKLFCKYYL